VGSINTSYIAVISTIKEMVELASKSLPTTQIAFSYREVIASTCTADKRKSIALVMSQAAFATHSCIKA